tara:strand:+ start:19 stop:540 length:522 start_codon:yes stop_codon:yes gene_type:complete
MAHPQQAEFCNKVKALFPNHFTGVNVLDCGSQDINGNNRYLFENSQYLGIDLGEGRNVDVVCPMSKFKSDSGYQTIISTEAFEHDKDFDASLKNILNLLLPGGLFLMTCAGHGRQEHGTHRTTGSDSPYTLDFYQNRYPEDFSKAIDLYKEFKKFSFEYNSETRDLYFWGLKY